MEEVRQINKKLFITNESISCYNEESNENHDNRYPESVSSNKGKEDFKLY